MPTPLNLLILDDREDDARLMVERLKQAGFEPCAQRVDSEAGFRAALDPALDLVIADFTLAGWNPLAALALVQSRDWDIPFVIVTNLAGEEHAVAAMRQGAADYLLKGNLTRLGTAVTHALEVRSLRAEKRAADAALRTSEARFRALIENGWEAVVLFSAQGEILYSSPAGERMLGYAPEEMRGWSAFDLIHPDERDLVARALTDCMQCPGRNTPVAARVQHRDGAWRNLEGMLTNLLHEPAVGAIVNNYCDVTERKRAEVALKDAQGRLERAVVAGGVGLWDWDLVTNEVYYSSEWKRHIGYADDEIAGDLEEWRCRVHPDDLERAMQCVKDYLNGNRPDYEVEFRFRHKDGSYRNILAHGSKLLAEDGTPARLIGSHMDVTDRTELQAQLHQAQKMEAVGQLAGGVAHDFNNMLAVINGYAELLVIQRPDDALLRPMAESILDAGRRAAALTQQLLAFSRRQIVVPRIVDLNEAVVGAERMLRRLIGEDLELAVVLAPDTACVYADPGQIDQVLVNLAVNARDAMPAGGRLTFQTRKVVVDGAGQVDQKAGAYVRLSVTDTGCGMDPATRAQIFEPFFTTKGVGQGTGLGLATVYGIVKQWGGFIRVASEPRKGTRFEIDFPCSSPVEREVPEEDAELPEPGRETILVVEDEPAVRSLIALILTSSGYRVLQAEDGEAALRTCAEYAGLIDLVLTDVVMPKLGGAGLRERLRVVRPGTKLVYMSGYTDDAVVRSGIVHTDVPFIQKPFTPAQLSRKIREVLDAEGAVPGHFTGKKCIA